MLHFCKRMSLCVLFYSVKCFSLTYKTCISYYVRCINKFQGNCGIAMSPHSPATLTLMGALHYEDKQTTSAHSRTINKIICYKIENVTQKLYIERKNRGKKRTYGVCVCVCVCVLSLLYDNGLTYSL